MLKLTILTSPVLMLVAPVYSQEESCETVRQNLEQKRLEVTSYSEAVQKLIASGDTSTATLLNKKIEDSLNWILYLGERLGKCSPGNVTGGPSSSTSSVKSDELKCQGKECKDLRKNMLQLLRKKHSLNRRVNSVFSQLTIEDQAVLRVTEQEIKEIQECLKKNCSRDTTPKFMRPNQQR